VIVISDRETTAIVGSKHTWLNHRDVLKTVSHLLERDSGYPVEIVIRPEAPNKATYVVDWRYIQFDPATDTWTGVADDKESSWRDKLRERVRHIFKGMTDLLTARMPTFDVDRTEIPMFTINGTYVFKYYFEDSDLFNQLKQYYNDDAYRFELTSDEELEEAARILDQYFFDLDVVDDPKPYCVVVPRNDDYSDILRNTVARFSRGRHYIFLLKDTLSVDQAIEQGATPLRESDVTL